MSLVNLLKGAVPSLPATVEDQTMINLSHHQQQNSDNIILEATKEPTKGKNKKGRKKNRDGTVKKRRSLRLTSSLVDNLEAVTDPMDVAVGATFYVADAENTSGTTRTATAESFVEKENQQNKNKDRYDMIKEKSSARSNDDSRSKPHIFQRTSPHYKTLIALIERKGWCNSEDAKLPKVNHDKELDGFMAMTGFSRQQVQRKFSEYLRHVLMKRQELLGEGNEEKSSNKNKNMNNKRVVHDDDNGSDKARASIKEIATRLHVPKRNNKTKTKGDDSKENNNNTTVVLNNGPTLPSLPPINLESLGLLVSPDQKKQHSSSSSSSANSKNMARTDLGALLATSPIKLKSGSKSAFPEDSPRVTTPRKSSAIHNPSPRPRTYATTLHRHLSWSTHPLSPPPPPTFSRIQTMELENMLKGKHQRRIRLLSVQHTMPCAFMNSEA